MLASARHDLSQRLRWSRGRSVLLAVERLDTVLLVTVGGLSAATALLIMIWRAPLGGVEAGVDLVLDTVLTALALTIVALAWVRYREVGTAAPLCQASAFLALAISSAMGLVLIVGRLDVFLVDLAIAPPREAPPWIAAAAHVIAAGLLVIGSLASLRGLRPRHPWLVLAGPSIALLAIMATSPTWVPTVPRLSDVFILVYLPFWPTWQEVPPQATTAGIAVGILTAGLFLWAAMLARRQHRLDGSMADAYLALGLVFAAFGRIASAFFPGTYAGLVTAGDVLELAFVVLILVGIEAEARRTRSALRQANVALERLKEAEVARAALEERTRLSRELHDGLAQDLWLAKLKAGRLAAQPDLGPEGRVLSTEVGTAIDAALAESRQAVMTLRDAATPRVSFREVLSRRVEEFGAKSGVRAEFRCDGELPRPPARVEVEVLRILQEALTNVHKHADATVVRVHAGVEDGTLSLSVVDNGRGFDLAETERGFGIAGMRERAELVNGELTVDSRPLDGTRVALVLPLSPPPVGAR